MGGICVAGSILVDRINEISKYPNVSELTKILDIKLATGGCVPNVAIDLKRLSPSLDVYAEGRVGVDGDGDFALSTMASEGVDVSMVRACPGTTSFTNVMSERGGKRTFFTYPGASSEFGMSDVTLDRAKFDMLHLGYFLLLDKVDAGEGVEILKAACELGITTSIDLVSENSDRYSLVRSALPYVDNLIINEIEAEKLSGITFTPDAFPSIARELFLLGVRERVIVHMTDSAYLMHGGEVTVLPSFDLPPDFIVGTTGAGDAFCAGALLAIHEGLSDREILETASISTLGALSCPDAYSGMRSLDELKNVSKGFKRL